MVRFLLFISILVLHTSCKKEKRAELPMEEEEVISLLGDMHFANSAVMILPKENRDSMKLIYETQVFEIHN